MRKWDDGGLSKKRFCKRCGHSWLSHTGMPPIMCPACQSRLWSHAEVLQRVAVLCAKCGYSWRPHEPTRRPVACPGCKSRAWDGLHDCCGRLLPGAVLPVIVPVVLAGVAPPAEPCGFCFGEGCPACDDTNLSWCKWCLGKGCDRCPSAVPVAVSSVPCFMCGGAGCPACDPSPYPDTCFACGGAGRADGLKCPICGVVRS
jgi:predicted Zn-ribbon and HTH transcriptional regulator